MDQTFWRKCDSCKKEIGYNSIYQSCSVSSCSRFAFCSVDCWELHVPVMNHKNAWAEENRSPAKSTMEAAPVRRIVVSQPSTPASVTGTSSMEKEILIVASKLKQYVKDKHDLNTSASVMDALSAHVRWMTDKAAEKAKADGRKTLMDKDF
jgi:hypothetical protein